MSTPRNSRALVRGALTMGALVLAGGLAWGGNALPVRQEVHPDPPLPDSGRTVSVCPAAEVTNVVSTTTWGGIGVRGLGVDELQSIPAGKGTTLETTTEPTLMVAEGRQTQGAAAGTFTRVGEGLDRGLSLARCGTPTTSAWFTGIWAQPDGAGSVLRSEILLVNPDDGQAEVDLRFYGTSGVQVASGGRGLSVPGRSSRVVAVDTLVTSPEPLGLAVRATRGRIAPMVRDRAAFGVLPAGTDWHAPSTPPDREQVIPGVPGGEGARDLVLTNPGKRRTTAHIEVLGREGAFVPVDAAMLDVNAESTARVDLAAGLAQEPGLVRVRSDEPLVAAVVARHSVTGAESELAIQSAASPLTGTSIGTIAAVPGLTGQVLVTNLGAEEVTVPMELVDTGGRTWMSTQLVVGPNRTVTWELRELQVPAAVVVRTPDGAELAAGVQITAAGGPAQGLATVGLSVPEGASSGVDPVFDPSVGQ